MRFVFFLSLPYIALILTQMPIDIKIKASPYLSPSKYSSLYSRIHSEGSVETCVCLMPLTILHSFFSLFTPGAYMGLGSMGARVLLLLQDTRAGWGLLSVTI